MKDIQQLIKKNSQDGRYESIFPKTFTDAVIDRENGAKLTDILAMFNMLFLSYVGSKSLTRLEVPISLRKTGIWITYVLYDKTVVTEWYAGEAIDDTSFSNDSNWRDGTNSLVGDISISSDGYWVINGEVTTIEAQGEAGITPILRVGSNNHLQVSYTNGSSYIDVSPNPVYTQFRVLNNKLQQSTDLGNTYTYISEELAYKFQESGNKLQMSKDLGDTWEDVSDYIAAWFRFTGTTGSSQADNVGKIQISRDKGNTWTDLSGVFTNSLHIKGYVATVDALPSTAVQGDIYGVGPTYDPSDTEHTNPIYQLYVKDSTGWINNGRFTSISAGVVQELGDSETAVISQKGITNYILPIEQGVLSVEHTTINLENEVFGEPFKQPTFDILLNGYMTDSGGWTPNQNYSFILSVKYLREKHITGFAVQYAFLKTFSQDTSILSTFVEGGSRITGNLSNIEIPNDANYLYIYLGNHYPSILPIYTFSEQLKKGLREEVDKIPSLEEGIYNLQKDVIPIVDKLNWEYEYDFDVEDESHADLINNIVLSQDGDSIELQVIDSDNEGNKWYAFAQNPYSSPGIAIGLSSSYWYVRADDETWLLQYQLLHLGDTIKISYENGGIKFYINGSEVNSKDFQKTLTISSFGNSSIYGFWNGKIANLRVNGVPYDLSKKAILSNVKQVNSNSFLSKQEKNRLATPSMMVEKTASVLTVYCKIEDTTNYFAYPFVKRYKEYIEGVYCTFYDNWGLVAPYITKFDGSKMTRQMNLFAGGESELAISVPRGDADDTYAYVGGAAHGYENIVDSTNGREISIKVDNQLVAELSEFELRACSLVDILQHTQLCQAYTNNNPFADVIKHWLFLPNTESSISITTKLKMLRVVPISMSQFGMFCVYRRSEGISTNNYLTNRGIKANDPFKVYELEDSWESDSINSGIRMKDYNCSKIIEYGEMGYGFSLEIKDANLKSNGGMFVATNNSSYNKIYFDLTGSYTPSVNEELYATQLWSFKGMGI